MQSWQYLKFFSYQNQISSQISAPPHWPTQGFLYSGCRRESSFAQSTQLDLWMKRTGNDPEMCDCSPKKPAVFWAASGGAWRQVLILTHHSALLRPHLSAVGLWGSQYKEHCVLLTNTLKDNFTVFDDPSLNVLHFKSPLSALVSKQTPTFGELQLKTHSLA